MHVCILGGGVIGVTTAYLLAERGHRITLIERKPAAGMDTSYANGGQLSYSHAEPWSNPALFSKLSHWIFQKNAPLVLRPNLDFRMWKWSLQFLAQATQKRADENTKNMLRLMLYSRSMTQELVARTKVNFAYRQTGILHIFRNQAMLEGNLRQADFQAKLGCPYEKFSTEDCVAREPALSQSASQLVGGLFYPLDESGDIHIFTQGLAHLLSERFKSVVIQYNTEIEKLNIAGRNVISAITSHGEFKADAFVMAQGSYSAKTLRQVGVQVPIYPMKGYSISVPVGDTSSAPMMSLTDQSLKVVYSRLGGVLRMAGTAEFAGYNHSIKESRIAHMKKSVQELFPHCPGVEQAVPWACLRPQTPDGSPILGRSPLENLYLNTGHGTLGWTNAAASAHIVADMVEGKKPAIDLTGLDISRF